MKKILILNYEYPPLGGGGGVASRSLALGWIKLGYSVDIVTSHYGDTPKIENIDHLTIYREPIIGRNNQFEANFISMFSFLLSGFLRTYKLCRKNNYYFLNTHFVLPTGPLGWIISKIFKIPNLLSLHGGDIYDPTKKNSPHKSSFFQKINRFLLNQATYIIAQSSKVQEYTQIYYQPDKVIKVIPLAYQEIKYKTITRDNLYLRNDIFYLITIGRLIKIKGYDYLIKALAELPKNIHLILIGDGPLKNELTNLAKKLNINNRIVFTGAIFAEKKMQYLANADLFVLSSIHESFSIVCLEAMQAGLPIVATNQGGQTDYLKNAINAILTKPQNHEILADKIKKLYLNHSMRKKLAINNAQLIEKFSPKFIAQQYLNLLNEN